PASRFLDLSHGPDVGPGFNSLLETDSNLRGHRLLRYSDAGVGHDFIQQGRKEAAVRHLLPPGEPLRHVEARLRSSLLGIRDGKMQSPLVVSAAAEAELV